MDINNFTKWLYFALAIIIISKSGGTGEEACTSEDPFVTCPFDTSKVTVLKFLRNVNYRTHVCETLQDFYACYLGNKENLTLDETCHPLFTSLVSSQNMSRDLCESQSPSQFHHDFYETFNCYLDWSDDLLICTYDSEKIFSDYLEILKRLDKKTESPPTRFRVCLKMKHKMDCLAKKISLICGDKAGRTFIEFLRGMFFMQMYCSQNEYRDVSNIIEVVKRVKAETIEKELSVKNLMDLTDFL